MYGSCYCPQQTGALARSPPSELCLWGRAVYTSFLIEAVPRDHLWDTSTDLLWRRGSGRKIEACGWLWRNFSQIPELNHHTPLPALPPTVSVWMKLLPAVSGSPYWRWLQQHFFLSPLSHMGAFPSLILNNDVWGWRHPSSCEGKASCSVPKSNGIQQIT